MNRAERRLLAKKGNAERMVAHARDLLANSIGTESTVNTYTIAAWVLHDRFGFGEKRIVKFLTELQDFATAVNKGYTNLTDLREELDRLYPGLHDAWEVRL